MSTAVLVSIVGALSLVSAIAISATLLWALRRVSRDRGAAMRSQFPQADLGPELGQYRGGNGDFSRVRNTAWIVLTPTTLVVRALLGSETVLPVGDITGTRIEKHFNGHWNGRPVLVLETARGEVGITVADPTTWQAALVR